MHKLLTPLLLLATMLPPAALAAESLDDAPSRRSFKRMDLCRYDQLFRNGVAAGTPCGKTHGTVLYAAGRFPRLKAGVQGAAWKGKSFRADGTFINRWPGFEAVTAPVSQGVSHFDRRPCLVMEYAPDAPVFGGVRDELREIASNIWLGRSTDAATGKFKNYFLLQEK